MAALNFPTTGLVAGVTQYTSDLGTTYIWDGVKWVGHSAGGAVGTNSIINNGNTVQVDAGGNLVLPAFAIPNTVGTVGQVLKWPASGSTLAWANDNNSGGSTYSNANVASYLVANPQSGTYSNTNVAAYLTGNITTGNIRAAQYNFANGVNILSTVGAGNANTGNFTFDADTIINTDGLILDTGRGSLAIGTQLEGPGGPQHFHIAFDGSNINPPANDLFLGDDYNYVKLSGTGQQDDYGVEIGAHNRDGGDQHVWRFSTDGNLKLTQGSTISDRESSVDLVVNRVSNNPYWYNLFGDTGTPYGDLGSPTFPTYANAVINGSVVHDSGGNVYVLGSTLGHNGHNFENINNNLFLKYSPLGELLWRRTWTNQNGFNCGSYNTSLRYLASNVALGTQDTILWAASVPWYTEAYVGTMDMEGNLVDQFGNVRLPTRLDNFKVTDLEWQGNVQGLGDSVVTVVGQMLVAPPSPGYSYPAVAGIDLDTATVFGDTAVAPVGMDPVAGQPFTVGDEWANTFKAAVVVPALGPVPPITALIGTYYDGDYSHAMVTLGAVGPPLTVGIGVDNYGSEGVIGEDICCDVNGNVYVIVNNIDSNYAVLIKANVNSIQSNSSIWQVQLGFDPVTTGDSFYATAIAYDNGYVYVLGEYYDNITNDRDIMLIKVSANNGNNIAWSRRIHSSRNDGLIGSNSNVGPSDSPGWESSSGISVYNSIVAISYKTEDRTPIDIGVGGHPSNTVTLQYPADGGLLGSFGDFEITDFDVGHTTVNYSITALTTSDVSFNITSGFATLLATTATVGTSWTNTRWDMEQNREVLVPQTFKFMADGTFDTAEIKHQTEVKITANTTVANATPSTWTFQNNRGLRFPDGTVQYGAYAETEIALDGGSAVTVFNIPLIATVADGGGSSSRFGVNDPVYDGNNDNYVLDGGGA